MSSKLKFLAPHGPAWLCLPALILLASLGCGRAFYRQQADQDVYTLVDQAAVDPRWPLDDFTIEIGRQSRLYDPYEIDHPPMPPDDPTSHRLMHCVDCKRGYPCWHANGDVADIESPYWETFLIRDAEGAVVLDMEGAVQTALVHSPDYQEELENLYLSALDVSFERFRFDAQFFGTNNTFFAADGPVRAGGAASSQLRTDTDFQMRRMFSTGGELVVGLANSLVWQFSGSNSEVATTLLDFSLVQPLLRAGGRARVLERLTISERALLANVRQMERFRRGFYAEIVSGRDAGAGPSRRGGFFGGSGLEGFSGVGGGGFGRVGGFSGGFGGGGGGFAGGAGAAGAGGFMGLLQAQQEIRNQAANVASLRDSLAQLEAAYQAGRIDRFQVDLAGQALYNAESVLLRRRADYESTLEDYKISLGLPPELNVKIEGRLLSRFELIDPRLTDIQTEVSRFLDELRDPDAERGLNTWEADVALLRRARGQALAHLAIVERDFVELQRNLPARRAALRRLVGREAVTRGDVEPAAFEVAQLERRVEQLQQDFARLKTRIAATTSLLEEMEQPAADADAFYNQLAEQITALSGELLELSLIQARARLDAIVLSPIELDAGSALEIARENRRDWMNARASLVDTWRLIEFNANNLESGLDLVFEGELGTVGDNPVRFRNTNGGLRVGLEFDAPITRLSERNVYRQALIEYQQARRGYIELEDRIFQGLRNTIRQIELNQINFELRRAAVQVGINQVDLARLRLGQPPMPGETSQFGDSTARDLVSALSDLLNVQNDFLSVWVNYEVQRLSLDFDLGTMELNDNGVWIDPGAVGPLGPRAPLQAMPSQGPELIPPQDAPERKSEDLPPPPDFEVDASRGDEPAKVVRTVSVDRRAGSGSRWRAVNSSPSSDSDESPAQESR